MHEYWIIWPLFNRFFQWYVSFTEDCISVKISYDEFVMNLQTDNCFQWAKKENQKHFSRHLRANRDISFLICRTFFISLSKKPKTEDFFIRFFYFFFFIDSSETHVCSIHITHTRQSCRTVWTVRLLRLWLYCVCVGHIPTLNQRYRQIKMHWYNSHSIFSAL